MNYSIQIFYQLWLSPSNGRLSLLRACPHRHAVHTSTCYKVASCCFVACYKVARWYGRLWSMMQLCNKGLCEWALRQCNINRPHKTGLTCDHLAHVTLINVVTMLWCVTVPILWPFLQSPALPSQAASIRPCSPVTADCLMQSYLYDVNRATAGC